MIIFIKKASCNFFITNKKEKKCHPPASVIEKFGLGTVITILCDLRNVNFFGLFFLNKIYKKLFFDLLIFFIYD